MILARARRLAALALLLAQSVCSQAAGAGSPRPLLQTYSKALEQSRGGVHDTPVARVVNLLEEIAKTLANEMDKDESLYQKMACWCDSNEKEKGESMEASVANIAELGSSIEALTAKKAELKASLKELREELDANRRSLAQATAIREKQKVAFHSLEVESVQAIKSLDAAIIVLSKHHGAPPKGFKSEKDSWSFLSLRSYQGNDDMSAVAAADRALSAGAAKQQKERLKQPGWGDRAERRGGDGAGTSLVGTGGTLWSDSGTDTQQSSRAWSPADVAAVQEALRVAAAFVQSHHAQSYYPAYASQSGQVLGVLQQLKDDMEENLSASQRRELEVATAFAELKGAKASEIDSGEKTLEQREEGYADTSTALSEAKLDRVKEENALTEEQRFMKALKETCTEAEESFASRKADRQAEMQAVAAALEILRRPRARDAMSGTFSFIQEVAAQHRRNSAANPDMKEEKLQQSDKRRQAASGTLRRAAAELNDPQLSMLASSVELDAFTRVKKAIDGMVAMLNQQQADEVKKRDYCITNLHETEVSTARKTDHKEDLESKLAGLAQGIKALEGGIESAQARIHQAQTELQGASEERKEGNQEFQKTVADQLVTIQALDAALDRLEDYYALLQQGAGGSADAAEAAQRRQAPPVQQTEYQPSSKGHAVMEMIQKLISDARVLVGASKHAENKAEAAYEGLVADTNGAVEALQKEVASRLGAKARLERERMQTESDRSDVTKELEGLSRYALDLKGECDYLLNNFDLRQGARTEEMEALRQAKAILSGASFSE